MKRFVRMIALVLIMALALSVPAFAASKLGKYTLIYEGKEVELSLSTGYLFKQGSAIMVPVEEICRLAALPCEVNAQATGMTITNASDAKIELKLNAKAIMVDGRKKALRTRVRRQDGKKLTADIRLLSELGLTFKHYGASKTTRANGYASGVLVIAKAGGDLSLPSTVPDITLPAAASEAAKTATQIVTVKQSDTSVSSGRLTFYQKKSGKWYEEFSAAVYLGKNGIGKQAEGDGKTPTGTYNLTQPFGLLASPGTKLGNYVKVTKNHYWSGQNGPYYNTLVDVSKNKAYVPNSKDEHLITYKGVYDYAIFIDYNKDGVANKGSAIFLHCMGSSKSTAGCIAVQKPVMKTLLQTLKPGAKIVIY